MMLHFMKTTLATLLIVAGTLDGVAVGPAQAEDAVTPPEKNVAAPESAGPKIQFAGTVYDFGKIGAGELVKHEFVFTNIGTATLEIKDVRPGCGCTTAGTWDKRVESGKTGVIPLQFNSASYSGTVAKSTTVSCNDPGQSNVVLLMRGSLWKPIDVTPSMAVFNLSTDNLTKQSRVLRIVSNLDEPVTLSAPQCTNRAFQTELKTVRPGKEFELHITAVPPFPATALTVPVTMKTSSAQIPTLSVNAYLRVQEPIQVTPSQITLPTGSLAAGISSTVAIRNVASNSLALSEAKVNVPGGEVRISELQPGRLFSLMLNLPAGFRVKPEQKIEVTVKSNHPRFPLIKVPVVQAQLHPVPPANQTASPRAQAVSPKQPASPATRGK